MSPLKRKSLWKWMKMDEGNLEFKFPICQCPLVILSLPQFSQMTGSLQWSSQLPSLQWKGPIWCLRALASVLVVCTLSWEWFSFWYFAYATGNLDSVQLSAERNSERQGQTQMCTFYCYFSVGREVTKRSRNNSNTDASSKPSPTHITTALEIWKPRVYWTTCGQLSRWESFFCWRPMCGSLSSSRKLVLSESGSRQVVLLLYPWGGRDYFISQF